MSGSGQRVDPQMLASAAKLVAEAPVDQLGTPLKELESLELSSADFGREHGSCFQGFKAGVERVSESVDSYLEASKNYGDALTSGGSAYASRDERAGTDVRDAGGMQ